VTWTPITLSVLIETSIAVQRGAALAATCSVHSHFMTLGVTRAVSTDNAELSSRPETDCVGPPWAWTP